MLTYIRYADFTRLRWIWSFEANYVRRDITNISMVYEAQSLSSNKIWEEKEKTTIIFHKLLVDFRPNMRPQSQNTKSYLWDIGKNKTGCDTRLLLRNLIKLLVRIAYWLGTSITCSGNNANIYLVRRFHQAKMHLQFLANHARKDIPNIFMVYKARGLSGNQI